LRKALRAAYGLPGVFPPSQINGRWVIDGALVNPLPVSVARAMDARIVIAINLHGQYFDPYTPKNNPANENSLNSLDASLDQENSNSAPQPANKKFQGKIHGGFARNAILNRFISSAPKDKSADKANAQAAPGLGEVLISSFNISMDRTTRSRLAADPADIMITPKVSHIPLLGFDEAETLIHQGRLAVDSQADEIIRTIEYLNS